jgi:PAS domain S-box-containing protein
MNKRGCEVLGYQPAEILGRSYEILIPEHSRDEVRQLFRRAMEGTAAPSGVFETVVVTRGGEERLIEWRQTLLHDEDGSISGILSSGLDMTERRQMERAIVEQASLARLGEMAAVVAHEIKNPLAGIGGAIQVMSSQLPPESSGRLMADEILERLDALNSTVNDMLLFARPRMPRPSPVPMLSLFEDIVALLRQDPQLKRVAVETRIPDIVVPCDADLLKPAFLNIVLNAAQAMKGEGRIGISVEPRAPYCRIAITDTGPGIPADIRGKIFEPFFSTKHRGTGLGLPIARRIVEAHGGQIEIVCPPGGGTTVAIDLPLRPAVVPLPAR